ncbi:MAG: hypothetical protein AAF378_00665 [Cyanobacteria bacterium P01_A01_bin.84]
MIVVINKSDLIPFLNDLLDIDVAGHILIEIDSVTYDSPLELFDSDFFLIKTVLALPPGLHMVIEGLDQVRNFSLKVFNIIVLGLERNVVCNELYSMFKEAEQDNNIAVGSEDNVLSCSWSENSSIEGNSNHQFIEDLLEEDYYFQSINLRTETTKSNGEAVIDAVCFGHFVFMFEINHLPGRIHLKAYVKSIEKELSRAFTKNNETQVNPYEDRGFTIGIIAWVMLALRNIARKQCENYTFCGNKEGILEIMEKERGHIYTCGIFGNGILVSKLNADDYDKLENFIFNSILEQANLRN